MRLPHLHWVLLRQRNGAQGYDVHVCRCTLMRVIWWSTDRRKVAARSPWLPISAIPDAITEQFLADVERDGK